MKQGVDYIGVTICFYCIDGRGKLLLQKRSDKCRDEHGKWDCGGGAVEFGETFLKAVKRELKEEYYIDVEEKDIKFCGVNNVLRKNGKENTHWIAIIFGVKINNPKKVKIGDPVHIDKIKWFPINNLPSPLHSMYLTHLKYVKKAGII